MAKDLCVLYANCQGEALAPLLLASPEFNAKYEIRHFLNYRDQELANADLKKCSLLLHQYLAPDWGVFSSASALERLPASAAAICVPNFFFKGYWPFWTNKIQTINFADSLLESLLARGLGADAVLSLYLKGSPALLGDVEAVALDSLAREREKERHSDIKYADIIENYWRDEPLFLTINHPGKRLLLHAANGVLNLLGLPPLSEAATKAYVHPQAEFELPIHPVVARRLNLKFGGSNARYACFGREVSHAEYISRYLACRTHGVQDFVGALRDLGESGG